MVPLRHAVYCTRLCGIYDDSSRRCVSLSGSVRVKRQNGRNNHAIKGKDPFAPFLLNQHSFNNSVFSKSWTFISKQGKAKAKNHLNGSFCQPIPLSADCPVGARAVKRKLQYKQSDVWQLLSPRVASPAIGCSSLWLLVASSVKNDGPSGWVQPFLVPAHDLTTAHFDFSSSFY